MDILSITGLFLGLVAVLVGAVLKGAGLHALLSAAAFMIVVVGTIAAICVQTPLPVMKHAHEDLPLGDEARRRSTVRVLIKQDGRVEQHRPQAGPARPRARAQSASPTRS